MKTLRVLLVILFLPVALSIAVAQPAKRTQKPAAQKPDTPAESEPSEPANESDVEKLKVDTNLVTVPVIASSTNGRYIGDLTKEEFKVSEDGTPQDVAFLATTSVPFHLVLVIDTSGSTKEKLGMIQRAASVFIEELSAADKVKVISFDDKVRDWNDFTSDKAQLRNVIARTQSGDNTKVYDAVQAAIDALRPINGRRAIVLFSDGADWHSDDATFAGTLHDLDESNVIVYPIRFDTRAETERIARQQEADQTGTHLPTSDIIRTTGTEGPPAGSTPSTFPSENPSPFPNLPSRKRPSLPPIIMDRGRNPGPQGSPTDPFPSTTPDRNDRRTTDPSPSVRTTRGEAHPDDSITTMLNQLYLMADSYLQELAVRSGGQVYRADTLAMLPQAFAAIASELRTQYLLGYYPRSRDDDGKYRKIQVKTTRKDVAIRARPGYRRRRGN